MVSSIGIFVDAEANKLFESCTITPIDNRHPNFSWSNTEEWVLWDPSLSSGRDLSPREKMAPYSEGYLGLLVEPSQNGS
jgi:hypothetical protein